VNLESEIQAWLAGYEIYMGSDYPDPIWGQKKYQVLKHKYAKSYLFIRPSDLAIEFVVESFAD